MGPNSGKFFFTFILLSLLFGPVESFLYKTFVLLQIVLKTSYNGVQLLSNFIKCPHVKVTEGSLEEGQSSDEVKEIIPIFLNPIRIPEENLHDLQEKVSFLMKMYLNMYSLASE